MIYFEKLKEVFVGHYVFTKKFSWFFETHLLLSKNFIFTICVKQENFVSENRASMKSFYLSTDNTCDKIERGVCSHGCDEDKTLSKFQNTFEFGQKLNLKLIAKQSCTGQFRNDSFVTTVS